MKKVIYLDKNEILYVIKSENVIFHIPIKKYSKGDYKEKIIKKYIFFNKKVKEYVPEDLYYFYGDSCISEHYFTFSDLINYIKHNYGKNIYYDKTDSIFYYKPKINIIFKDYEKNKSLDLTFEDKQEMYNFIEENDLSNYIKK